MDKTRMSGGVNPLYRPRSSGWVTGSVEMLDNVPVENGGPDRLLYTYNKDLGLLHLSKSNVRSYITLRNGEKTLVATLPQDAVGQEAVTVPVGAMCCRILSISGVSVPEWGSATLYLQPDGGVYVDTDWTGTFACFALMLNLTIPMAGCGNGWPEANTT